MIGPRTYLEPLYPKCPGQCEDGILRGKKPDGTETHAKCWHINDNCFYAVKQKQAMQEYIVNEVISKAAIPEIHRQAMRKKQYQTDALKAVSEWKFKEQPFLLLCGGKGVGKSYAAAHAYLHWVCDTLPKGLWRDQMRWINQADWEARALCWEHAYKLSTDRNEVKNSVHAPFLVIDDLGSEDTNSSGFRPTLNYIISERYDALLPTVITANLTSQDILLRYGERMLDRVNHEGIVVPCTGKNIRYE